MPMLVNYTNKLKIFETNINALYYYLVTFMRKKSAKVRKLLSRKEYTGSIVRTSTTESLLAESDEQVEAEIAISRLVKVFQSP